MRALNLSLRRRFRVVRGRGAVEQAYDAAGTQSGPPAREKTAFVLLGGGARGAAQAGAITVLLSAGIVPDYIVGISAGSWNGAFIAQIPSVERALELESLWMATTSLRVLGPHRWRIALNALGNRQSLYDSDGLRSVARMYLAGLTFENVRVPLSIVATNLVSGEAKLFTEGALLHAVLASSAMPGIFPPVRYGQDILVDGGLAEWAGCQAAIQAGATRICLVGCGSVTSAQPRIRTFRHIFERSWEIGLRFGFDRTVFALSSAGIDVLPVFPEFNRGSVLDFDQAPGLITAGRMAAERAVEQWRAASAALETPPHRARELARPLRRPASSA